MRAPATTLALAALLVPALSGCFGTEARTEWAFEVTQLSALADEGRTGRGVRVAVLDTGIDVGHVALTHLVDGDLHNGELVGFQDYVAARNGVAQAYDDDGHGTHVAGIIAASGSSLADKIEYGGVALLGGAPGVHLLVAKVCGIDAGGRAFCDADAIPRALEWAVAQKADVVNLSLGGVAPDDVFANLCLQPSSCPIANAVRAAVAEGVVVVAAAGNDGPGNDDVSTPGDVAEAISVGAIQKDGSVWVNSSRGDDAGHPCTATSNVLPNPFNPPRCDPNKKPELVAPGVQILSAWTGGRYVQATGTSQATPFVTAAVALMLEGRPDLRSGADVVELKQALVASAKRVPGQAAPHDDAAGYGLLQAKAALAAYGS
jgi:subtilisin family serine protease